MGINCRVFEELADGSLHPEKPAKVFEYLPALWHAIKWCDAQMGQTSDEKSKQWKERAHHGEQIMNAGVSGAVCILSEADDRGRVTVY
jgi:hypothetical protein